MLYLRETLQHRLVVGVLAQLRQLREVGYPAVAAQKLGYKRGKLRVAERQPTARRYAVRLVLETLREKLVPIVQSGVFQYLGVNLRNAVDILRAVYGKLRHVHLSAGNGLHTLYAVAGNTAAVQIRNELLVYLKNYRVYVGQKLLNDLSVPLFESLRHNGVVGVVECLLRDRERLLERHSVLLDKDTNKLWYGDNGVRIVKLNGVVLRERIQMSSRRNMTANKIRHGRRAEEVLLL